MPSFTSALDFKVQLFIDGKEIEPFGCETCPIQLRGIPSIDSNYVYYYQIVGKVESRDAAPQGNRRLLLGAGHSGVSYVVRIKFTDLADRVTSVNMIL